MRHECLITTLLKFHIQFSSELFPQSSKWPFPKKFVKNSACISCLCVPHNVSLLTTYCDIHTILEITMYMYIFKKWVVTCTIHEFAQNMIYGNYASISMPHAHKLKLTRKKVSQCNKLTGVWVKEDKQSYQPHRPYSKIWLCTQTHILVDECGENDMESGTETDINNSGCSQKWVYWLLQNKI